MTMARPGWGSVLGSGLGETRLTQLNLLLEHDEMMSLLASLSPLALATAEPPKWTRQDDATSQTSRFF